MTPNQYSQSIPQSKKTLMQPTNILMAGIFVGG